MGVTKNDLLAMEDDKKNIEKELEEAFAVLKNNNIGMDEPLVDAEDFPRADISVYEVRIARSKINKLRNDHRVLIDKLTEGLCKYHQANPETSPATSHNLPTTWKRLAKVDLVEVGSPAEFCGLRNGDYIVEIGGVNESNFKGLDDIAKAIKSSENYYMKVVLERDSTTKRINLKPRLWGGPSKGLLGCKILNVINQ